MPRQHVYAKWVFYGAAIYGLIALLPQYFLEDMVSRMSPPAITHPENFYGFIGVALAWQVAFLIIGSDVVRFRPMMLPAMLEKVAFGGAAIVLFMQSRVDVSVLMAGLIDLLLAMFFVTAFVTTRKVNAV